MISPLSGLTYVKKIRLNSSILEIWSGLPQVEGGGEVFSFPCLLDFWQPIYFLYTL